MKGTRPLDNDEIRSLGLESGLNFRWQYMLLFSELFHMTVYNQ